MQLEGACFVAGTPLLTPGGSKLIEQFRVGDAILSRSEFDPTGPIEAKVVEEVFVRTGRVAHLHAGGEVIGTTLEHPFFEAERGWVQANELHPGDRIATLSGEWVRVEEVYDTGEWAVVYNLRIADHHTYFVGCEEWGFSVWAHNACYVHYTTAAGLAGILASNKINASTGTTNARYGDGQYFTDIFPTAVAGRTIADLTPADVAAGRISLGQLAYILYGAGKYVSKIEYYVIVDLDGQNVLNPVPHNFMIPNTAPLDVTGKIVGSGKTVP